MKIRGLSDTSLGFSQGECKLLLKWLWQILVVYKIVNMDIQICEILYISWMLRLYRKEASLCLNALMG